MFHKNIKLVLAGFIIAFGIYQFTENNIGNGIFLILFSTLFIFLYFKNEFILLAFLKLRKQDFPGAQKWLSNIKNPEAALVQKQQGYFNYLHGLMVSQTNLNEAERYFKKAIALGLSMDQDLALAKLQLAGIAMTRRRKMEATALLNEAIISNSTAVVTGSLGFIFSEKLSGTNACKPALISENVTSESGLK
jgi:tetratricopeptide (TPR) repeat protein